MWIRKLPYEELVRPVVFYWFTNNTLPSDFVYAFQVVVILDAPCIGITFVYVAPALLA